MRKRNYHTMYRDQRGAAERRGIKFQFTFEEWIEWWGEDIENRGRKRGQFVMARFGDTGPYHPSNVFKQDAGDNYRDGQIGRTNQVSGADHCKAKPVYVNGEHYVTRTAAANAYDVVPQTIDYWIKNNKNNARYA